MKRWNTEKKCSVENAKIDAFLIEVVDVCRRHGFSIGHEDGHGSFLVERFDDSYSDWLMDAADVTNEPLPKPR